MEVTGNPGGTGLLWTAMLTTLFVISRALTRRPLRGQLSDVENHLTLLLAIAGTIAIQVVYAFTTVGAGTGRASYKPRSRPALGWSRLGPLHGSPSPAGRQRIGPGSHLRREVFGLPEGIHRHRTA